MKKINVLVFPAGEVNSLELHDALATCVNIELYGASSVDRHGKYKYKNYIHGLPLISEEKFIGVFNEILNLYQIDLVIPTHDTVSYYFSENRDKLTAQVLIPEGRTAEICRFKSKTYNELAEFDFLPKIYDSFDNFPVFIKPDDGQGGQGAQLIESKKQIPIEFDLCNYIICEYLPGTELSVDCFTDKNGKLIIISPRTRERTMAGISVAGENAELTAEIKKIAECINSRISFLGLWFFQIKQDNNGNWKLLEVAARCASSMSLTRALGFNLPLMSIYAATGKDVVPLLPSYSVKMDRTLISRYEIDYCFETAYIDFDDTIIVREKVHLPAIWLVYQLNNQNKEVVLITRHEHDLDLTLKYYKIDRNLFSKIIHIQNNEPKASYIKEGRSIFIDNSFQERQKVYERCSIPVFDVDAIEVLMDWRI